ncbi:DUF1553 domain-containing protein [Bremerella cremea]|uniref:DUF1553 domain-containing protein n=1 Tax=Bremerella cremea TaxID=1031537 RepID=UPI0031EC321E
MVRSCLVISALLVCAPHAFAGELPPAAEKTIQFESDIAPILQAKCHDCHGEFTQEGNLRLDRKAAVIRGGDSGEPGIVPGKSAESHLIRLVAGLEADLRMPPEEEDTLSKEQIGLLRAWIDQGAPWPGPAGSMEIEKRTTDHWAFQPVKRPSVPEAESDWGRNPIDRFILAKLEANGLKPSERADRRTLARRFSLDVLGLPPTPEEVAAYADSEDPAATEKWIETMLASPHFGERWASHWLDLVRFAETHGFETNRERPNAWRYRDYVIDSLNADKPYDQFIREQIAGDSFGSPVGLGFLVAGPYDQVKSPDINLTLMQRQNELDDIVNTTGTAFLGLTMGCARCHNHKFDPILQTDYYSMQAIFSGVRHADTPLPFTAEQQKLAEQLRAEIVQLEGELEHLLPQRPTSRFVMLDDDPEIAVGKVKHLVKAVGNGTNLPGTERGQASDPGDESRSLNVSGGKYSWWKHQPGVPVISWTPASKGQFRLWLSWGCGFTTHCQDARYVIDRDGNPATNEDWEVVAIVNQQQFANGDLQLKSEPMWSGFFQAGLVTLGKDDQILLVGGMTGTALTADVMVLEHIRDSAGPIPPKPFFREPVRAIGNVEHLHPIETRSVRFVIEDTVGGTQPCIDELAIFSGVRNVALASEGSVASASGTLPGYEIHQLKHINDGQFSNRRSWIADTRRTGWVQIDLPQATTIDRIEWARDREGQFNDRLAIHYRIEASLDGVTWKTIADSSDRLPVALPSPELIPSYQFESLPSDKSEAAKAAVARLLAAREELQQATTRREAYAGRYEQPGPTHRLYRGEPQEKREQVLPDAPEIFANLALALDSPEKVRRQKLAEWIASRENPLTARVIVNRIWQFHFGTGLVDTPSDFGAAGVEASHPELLDWLASELMDHDWSLKHIHRLILQSATFQQASQPDEAGLRVDGATRHLWRYPPHRMEAEPIRDSILSVTGVLDNSMGGPGFTAFEVEAENVRHYHPKKQFGPEDWRRMVYMTKVRMEKDAIFGLLDCPDAATSVAKRSRSTTPLQALNLFNSAFLLQQADLFSQRLRSEANTTGGQVRLAFELCYSRSPSAEEAASSQQFIEQEGLPAFCRALLNSNEFLFIP